MPGSSHSVSSSKAASRWSARAPYLQSVLRIVAAFMYTLAGTSKLFAFPAAFPGGTPKAFTQLWFAGILETIGGALLLLGLFTRPVALLLAGEMAVAYFQVHFPKSFWPTISGGTAAALYCFIWLYLSAAGGGPWSLDAKRRRG